MRCGVVLHPLKDNNDNSKDRLVEPVVVGWMIYYFRVCICIPPQHATLQNRNIS